MQPELLIVFFGRPAQQREMAVLQKDDVPAPGRFSLGQIAALPRSRTGLFQQASMRSGFPVRSRRPQLATRLPFTAARHSVQAQRLRL
jgi:hypothetical protein